MYLPGALMKNLLVLPLLLLPLMATAKEKAATPGKLTVEGTVLIYDTERASSDTDSEITDDDIPRLRALLEANPDIAELQLNSGGGSVWAGGEIAWIIADYGLDTVVSGECVSACVDIFLAGKRRRMLLGSKIGFHQRHWAPSSVENYYTNWHEDEGWDTPFEFGSWIYSDTQTEIYQHLTFMVDQGVEPGFAIKTLRVQPGDEWYPSRLQLIAAGVLRETAEGPSSP